MLGSLLLYLKWEVKPRFLRILFSFPTVAAIVVAGIIVFRGDCIAFGTVKLGEIMTGLLAYAAVSFGFSIAALSLILAIPHGEFAVWLAARNESHSKNENNSERYDDLLFVYSWTAVLHWLLLLTVIVLVVAFGGDYQALPLPAVTSHRIPTAWLAFITTFGLLQFLTALLTLALFGRVYVMFLRTHAQEGK